MDGGTPGSDKGMLTAGHAIPTWRGGVLFPTSPSSSVKPAACPTIQLDSDTVHPETMSGATAQELVDSESPTLPPPTSGANHRSWLSPVLLTDQQ